MKVLHISLILSVSLLLGCVDEAEFLLKEKTNEINNVTVTSRNGQLSELEANLREKQDTFLKRFVLEVIGAAPSNSQLVNPEFWQQDQKDILHVLSDEGIIDTLELNEAIEDLFYAIQAIGGFLDANGLESMLQSNTMEFFNDNVMGAPDDPYLPCYQNWETSVAAATGAYAVCIAGTGFTLIGAAACTVGYGIAIIAAENIYDNCLDQYSN